MSREGGALAPFIEHTFSKEETRMSSEPARNLVHALLLAIWAVVGVLVTPGDLLGRA
jgi:hypothetical protein